MGLEVVVVGLDGDDLHVEVGGDVFAVGEEALVHGVGVGFVEPDVEAVDGETGGDVVGLATGELLVVTEGGEGCVESA